MTFAPGSRLGPYELLAPLGAGGMGEVWRAMDLRLGREVALKVMSAGFGEDADRVRRFEQEARALAALSHPNILAIFDVGTQAEAPYLVTELLEGETLRERLARGPLTIPAALDLAAQVVCGLAAAHAKGFIHRDLKPENVFLAKEGVKLLDFGLAKQGAALGPGPCSQGITEEMGPTTTAGAFVGTLGYMSPEQVRGEAVDGRSDLFALGLLLYEMLTGRSAFAGATGADTLSAILLQDPPELEALARRTGLGLASVLRRCLEKRREDRFPSAEALGQALLELAEVPESTRAGKSIAVLPFENLSPDPDNAYFADGLTEELIADLSQVRCLRVISRTSVMHFKGMDLTLPTIARELGVGYVLEGSVRRAGNSLRITAQLIEANTDVHLWAQNYSGTLEDVFDMQEQVSRAIVHALELRLSPAEEGRLAARPLPNAAAYDAYLRAARDLMAFTPEALDRGRHELEQAIGILGEHPVLLAALSTCHAQSVNLGLECDEGLERARALARRALVLDPDCPVAHAALGMLAMFGNYPEGICHLRMAVKGNPADVGSRAWLSVALVALGQVEQATAQLESCIDLDPLNPVYRLWSAMLPTCAGDFEAALRITASCQSCFAELPAFRFFHAYLLALSGRREEALQFLDELRSGLLPDTFHALGRLLQASLQGRQEVWDGILSPELRKSLWRDPQNAAFVADLLTPLGREEEAFEWLSHGIAGGWAPVDLFARDPFLAAMREDPRWPGLMDRARAIRASVSEGP